MSLLALLMDESDAPNTASMLEYKHGISKTKTNYR